MHQSQHTPLESNCLLQKPVRKFHVDSPELCRLFPIHIKKFFWIKQQAGWSKGHELNSVQSPVPYTMYLNSSTSHTILLPSFPYSQFAQLSHHHTTHPTPLTIPIKPGKCLYPHTTTPRTKHRVSCALDFQCLELRVHVVLYACGLFMRKRCRSGVKYLSIPTSRLSRRYKRTTSRGVYSVFWSYKGLELNGTGGCRKSGQVFVWCWWMSGTAEGRVREQVVSMEDRNAPEKR